MEWNRYLYTTQLNTYNKKKAYKKCVQGNKIRLETE